MLIQNGGPDGTSEGGDVVSIWVPSLLIFAVSDFHLIIDGINLVSPVSGVHLGHMVLVASPQRGWPPPLLSPPQLSQGMAPLAIMWGSPHHSANQTTAQQIRPLKIKLPVAL